MFVVVLVYIPCFDLIRALLLRHAGAQRIVILGAAPGNISLCISPLLVGTHHWHWMGCWWFHDIFELSG